MQSRFYHDNAKWQINDGSITMLGSIYQREEKKTLQESKCSHGKCSDKRNQDLPWYGIPGGVEAFDSLDGEAVLLPLSYCCAIRDHLDALLNQSFHDAFWLRAFKYMKGLKKNFLRQIDQADEEKRSVRCEASAHDMEEG